MSESDRSVFDPISYACPNLAGVITKDDVATKGSGAFKADYVNWARIAHLLHVHAPGWEFHLRFTPDHQHIWKAPNGTGYVVGYFTGPGGRVTPDFPQSVMDNRNAPVPYDRISARDVTDTHRRCLCTAAAYSFGLAYELWAKEEVENPHREEQPSASRQSSPAPAAPSKAPAPAAPPLAPSGSGKAPWDLLNERLNELGITAYGMRTVLAITEVNSINEIPDVKANAMLKAVGADHIKMFNQGKNSKGAQIIAAPVADQVKKETSIDEMAKALEQAFADE